MSGIINFFTITLNETGHHLPGSRSLYDTENPLNETHEWHLCSLMNIKGQNKPGKLHD